MNQPYTSGSQVEVLLPRPLPHGFDYRVPAGMALRVGDFVQVPFGKSQMIGVVWGDGTSDIAPEKCKSILTHYTHMPPLSAPVVAWLNWVASYTLSPVGALLKMVMPLPDAVSKPATERVYRLGRVDGKISAARQKVVEAFGKAPSPLRGEGRGEGDMGRGQRLEARGQESPPPNLPPQGGGNECVAKTHEALQSLASDAVLRAMVKEGQLQVEEKIIQPTAQTYHPNPPTLSPEQQTAAAQLESLHGFQVALLDGVTGSGKTETYFHAAAEVLARGGQVLVLLPEIALTVGWIARFEKYFGAKPLVWHSDISEAQRRKNWQAIASGAAKLVVGARSALFLPYPNLSLIVVDEEHEASYKQEEGVHYHARDMAIARAQKEHIPIVLVSATPSLETLHNVEQGRYQHVCLPARFGGASMPDVALIDMREQKMPATEFISPALREAMAHTLAQGQQVLLFLNRRGYAPLVLCRACGHRLQCGDCSAWMVWHQRQQRLQCHHCDVVMKLPPACPACKAEDKWAMCGPGVERVREEVAALLPDVPVAVLSSDMDAKSLSAELERIERGEVPILIGTQMVGKGHHFPHLTLVGVVDADLGLEGGDPRVAERNFQLLHQLSGRAGREQVKGRVLLQTYQPDHPVMKALMQDTRDPFMRVEMNARKQACLPPFGRLAAIILEGPNEMALQQFARSMLQKAPQQTGVRILGPAPAPISKVRGNYRVRFLLKSPKDVLLQPFMAGWVAACPAPSSIRVKLDVDPYSFL